MKRYSVLIVKEAAIHSITQELLKRKEQRFNLYANSEQTARTEAIRLCTLPLEGNPYQIFIDGQEHFDQQSR